MLGADIARCEGHKLPVSGRFLPCCRDCARRVYPAVGPHQVHHRFMPVNVPLRGLHCDGRIEAT